jgi:thiamine-phosphate pyrophosphorylase
VGQDDLSPAHVRGLLGERAIVGLSTHTPRQIGAALDERIDYLAIGPVFQTGTKQTGYEAVGLEAVREASAMTQPRRLPVVAIGGITLDRARSAVAAGAVSVAVISDLLVTGDPAARVREYLARFESDPAEADIE